MYSDDVRSRYPGWHVPAGKILGEIRTHYKTKHPRKFRASIRKGGRTRHARNP